MRATNLLYSTLFLVILTVPCPASANKVGGGDLWFTPKGAQPVLFSHEEHVVKKGIKCSGCHYQIFQMSQGSYKMHMEKITKGDFCGRCHNGQKAFAAKESANCSRCHRS